MRRRFVSIGRRTVGLFPLLRGDLLVDTEVLFDCGYALESAVDLFSETANRVRDICVDESCTVLQG